MRSKDHLFLLIQSLSKSEKRYFTLDARKSGRRESRYLELFQLINDMDTYDEAAVKAKFGNKVGDDKARLYEAILNALRDYQSKKSYKTRIKELLTDAKILVERKLYEQAENRLDEAKALAIEIQDHLAVLEINLQQRQLIKAYQHKDYADQVENLITESGRHLKIVEAELWLNDHYDRLSVDYLKFHNQLNAEQVQDLQQKYAPVLAYQPQADTFFTIWRLHQLKALYYRLSGNVEQEFQEFEHSVALWPQFPKIWDEYYLFFLGDKFNLLSMASRSEEKFHRLPQLLADLEREQATAPNSQVQNLLFERISIYRLVYLLNTRNLAFDAELEGIEQGLEKYHIAPSSKLTILLNAVLLLFLSDRFSTCILWLDKLWKLQRSSRQLRQDIQHISRIIFLLTVYKVGEYEEIENALRAVKRYFHGLDVKPEPFLAFHQLIAEGIAKNQAAVSQKEERAHWVTLKSAVEAFPTPLPGGLNEITLLWIDSILLGKNISTLRDGK